MVSLRRGITSAERLVTVINHADPSYYDAHHDVQLNPLCAAGQQLGDAPFAIAS
jgi:hypothetical protein